MFFKKILIILLAICTLTFSAPLAEGAAKFLGNITTNGQVRSDFGQYWNQITAENECKWASIEGSRGRYNWGGCDAAYNWAKQNNAHFKFHALVWGSQYPNWLNGLSTADTKTAITNWFDAVKNHYPEIEMIDVVNEAIKTGGSYHSGYGNNNNIIPALGGDNGNYEFVVTAFKMARDRWPNAILIYNDYNTVQWQKNEGIDLINKIKKGGAPVDAYGLQAHDMQVSGGQQGGQGGGGSCLNINTLKSAIEEIWNKTNMPMFISEYDIATEDDNDQKNCYEQQISYFMENEHIAGITLWGYIYGSTWTTNGNSGIIRNGQDRKAMTWLKEYFANNKDKSKNTTGLAGGTTVEPEPQTPFKEFNIPTKIEAEDFDIPGKGSGNNSYSVGSSGNGNSEYRKGEYVNLYDKATGVVIGYNSTGNYYQYTINVKESGTYTITVNAASENGGACVFKVGDKSVGKEVTIDATGDYDTFKNFTTTVELAQGTQILTLEVTKEYFDIDYFTIEKEIVDCGDNCGDINDSIPPVSIGYQETQNTLQHFRVFSANGVFLGVVSGYTLKDAISYLTILKEGIYFIGKDGKYIQFKK